MHRRLHLNQSKINSYLSAYAPPPPPFPRTVLKAEDLAGKNRQNSPFFTPKTGRNQPFFSPNRITLIVFYSKSPRNRPD
jgi:hypothetical protein